MFSVHEKKVNGFDIVELVDENSGTIVSVIPGTGAVLQTFAINHNGTLLNVVDCSLDDLKNIEATGFKSCKLSPFVCRLKNGQYHFGERDYKIEKFYLGKHAIHGLIYDAAFSVEGLQADEVKAIVSLKHEYRANDKGYPFNYDCLVSYELGNNNELTIHTRVINKDAGHIPVSDGWHPYFGFGGSINDLQLEFQSKYIIDFDKDLLPTGDKSLYEEFGSLKPIGNTQLDNCFTANFAECQPMLVLRDPVKKIQLEISPGKSYPYLQIYTPPHRKSIAIENLSSAPDAFNNNMDLLTLAPGTSADFTTTYKLTILAP